MKNETIEDYIDKKVMVTLAQWYVDDNASVLRIRKEQRRLYVHLKGVDHRGLWIRNTYVCVPQGSSQEEKHPMVILIPWSAVSSVGFFPGRGFPDEGPVLDTTTNTIGFVPGPWPAPSPLPASAPEATDGASEMIARGSDRFS